VVSVSELLRGSFAAQMAALRADIASSWTPLAPEAGFILWADRLTTSRFTGADLALPALELLPEVRWNEAPVLAAVGYHLDLDLGVWEHALEHWVGGAARLIQRDPFPADRSAFAFRPMELLGVALGARAAAGNGPDVRTWLTEVIADRRFPPARDHWAAVLGTLTRSVLGETPPQLTAATADLADTAVSLWIFLALPDLVAADDADSLRRVLLEQAATETLVGDNTRRAVLWVALDHAVRTLLGSAVSPGSGASPADQVVALCRQFPGFVRELQRRQRGRDPVLVENEYDVQDLMRAVLRLHFVDVREEETTPSHAGLRPRMDFLLKVEQVVLETKMTRAGLKQRQLAEEIAVDKESYRAHPDCRTVVFFVYDPDHRVANPAALEAELSEDDGRLRAIVIVSPS
jgi:hypothetical protein